VNPNRINRILWGANTKKRGLSGAVWLETTLEKRWDGAVSSAREAYVPVRGCSGR
jgi:hypothetical protein